MAAESTQFSLDESRIPEAWFNVVPSMPTPPSPPIHPGTKQPIGPDDLAPLFPMALIGQEVTTEEWVDIPGPVMDIYKMFRPSPLVRARRLEKVLGTPARIYYKYEGVSAAGSHKPNTAIAQAYYNKAEGVKRISTETGAGQWGSAMAMACAFFDLECQVYMVRASYNQKPGRRTMMQTWGARVIASPSNETEAG
ncbi:MAG TPA: pyridoxal-phosphate dependent enzyme, partial [Actinomycetota bacterium]|nr:pyridoxal-phosphate dependent enzyme [Actinomycetota bacterium]